MTDDDMIKRLEDLAHSANQEALSFGVYLDPFMRLALAAYALGRQAGLDEAAEKGRDIVLRRIRKRGSGDFGDAEAQADAVEALRELVDALDGAFISSWQSTAAWQTQLDRARAALATQGGGNAE